MNANLLRKGVTQECSGVFSRRKRRSEVRFRQAKRYWCRSGRLRRLVRHQCARAVTWNLSLLAGQYQEPYLDTPSTVTQVPRHVSAYDTINTQASYTGLRHFDFTLGVINLFNQSPPYANYASIANNFVGGYDLTYGDPRGRYIYATVRYHLH